VTNVVAHLYADLSALCRPHIAYLIAFQTTLSAAIGLTGRLEVVPAYELGTACEHRIHDMVISKAVCGDKLVFLCFS
jgi:hypothetical protein